MTPKWQTSRHASQNGVGQVGALNQAGLLTDLSFRLWTVPSIPLSVSAWKADHPVIFLIADLVGACGGSVKDNEFTAHFPGAVQAISAAKVIVRSVLEYSSCGDARAAGLAVAAYPAAESGARTEPSNSPAWLEQAEPGQVLVHPETCKRLRNTDGVRFRPTSLDGLAVSRGSQK